MAEIIETVEQSELKRLEEVEGAARRVLSWAEATRVDPYSERKLFAGPVADTLRNALKETK